MDRIHEMMVPILTVLFILSEFERR